MTREELIEKLNIIQNSKCETQTLEIKAAEHGCPKRLYDTLSSFSNQDEGGTIIFGIDEGHGFYECGVYDAQDIQKKINEQCLQMEPVVRPLITVAEKGGKFFASAEIPGIDLAERPCYYRGRGRMKGSYVRVGDSDEPMTENEIYSYEAFRKRYQDDIRPVYRASLGILDQELLEKYIERLKREKPNLSSLPQKMIYELMSITKDDVVTLSSMLLFCGYPQAFFPQLCITAVVVPGNEIGEIGSSGERFIDNKRIEGNIPEMLEQAITFVRKNMRIKTIINPETGKREDRADYPVEAIREALLNALSHRDYSIHTEGMPIQLLMFSNRIEIRNPGGIYGRLSVDQLGKMQPDTRNPVLVAALEMIGLAENRYSGIPTIRRAMKEFGLSAPVFADERGAFSVTLFNSFYNAYNAINLQDTVNVHDTANTYSTVNDYNKDDDSKVNDYRKISDYSRVNDYNAVNGYNTVNSYNTANAYNTGTGGRSVDNISKGKDAEAELLRFLEVPRTRKEIAGHLGIGTITYAMQTYIDPLIESGRVRLTIPDKPRSQKQKYVRVKI